MYFLLQRKGLKYSKISLEENFLDKVSVIKLYYTIIKKMNTLDAKSLRKEMKFKIFNFDQSIFTNWLLGSSTNADSSSSFLKETTEWL